MTHPTTPDHPVDHVSTLTRSEKRPRVPSPGELGTCRCGAVWTGRAVAHCGACHRTFAAPSLFDRHRHTRGEHGGCTDPAQLTTKAGECVMAYRSGMWRSPEMPADAKARMTNTNKGR